MTTSTLNASQKAEATIAVGALMRHLPADRVEVNDLGIVVETDNPFTYNRWATALQITDDFETQPGAQYSRIAVGALAGVDARIYLMVEALEVVL